MSENLKVKTVTGIKWSVVERFSTLFIQFFLQIVLARLLLPEVFGIIAILSVFIQISQVFIDSGFSYALIQNKNRTNTDYCTIFYFNLVVACILYLLLYFCAPYVEKFYSIQNLAYIMRILCINIVIGSFGSIHRTKLTIELKFKVQALITLISTLSSGTISVLLAWNGYGIWALVIQNIINYTLQSILLFIIGSRWIPSFVFSIESFKKMFAYSSKVLGASLISLLYRNIYPVIIGKRFSTIDLGYYNRADTFSSLPISAIMHSLSRVSFPTFSQIQDDNSRLKNAYSKYIKYSSFIVFPIMIGLVIIGEPLIKFLLTEKWIMIVPIFQILCIDYMFDHISAINLNILYVKGYSDLALKLEIIKKAIAISILLVTLHWGIFAICCGRVLYSLVAVFINSYYTKRLIGLSVYSQIRDFTPFLLFSIIAAIIVLIINKYIGSSIDLFQILISVTIGGSIYGLLIYHFYKSILIEFIQMLKFNKKGIG